MVLSLSIANAADKKNQPDVRTLMTPEDFSASGLDRLSDAERAQTAPETPVIQNLVAVFLQGTDAASQHINIHVFGIPGTREKEAKIDAALEDIKARV